MNSRRDVIIVIITVTGDMMQTFKIIKGLEDIPVERFFTVVNSNTQGHMFKLAKPRCNTSFRL